MPAILGIVKRLQKWFEPEVSSNISRTLHNLSGFVFVYRGKIVGFILYKLWKKTSEIKWFGVLPGYHSKGVGSRLLKVVEKELKSKNILDVTVTTLAPTIKYKPYDITRRFYSKHGYSKIRIDEKFWKNRYDRLVLIKEL